MYFIGRCIVKGSKYVLFAQQDRKRSLFAFFSLRNLVSTRIQIGNQKEVIDHSRPGLLSTHTCCMGEGFYNPSQMKCINQGLS